MLESAKHYIIAENSQTGDVDAWNNLPTSVSFTSLPAFSRTIRSVDFRNFLKCNSC